MNPFRVKNYLRNQSFQKVEIKKITTNNVSVAKSNVPTNIITNSNLPASIVIKNNIQSILLSRNSQPTRATEKKNVIPLNIFQTWHTLDLPIKMKENIELIKNQNPEFSYYLYDDEMCRDFIKDTFDGDVLFAFDKLKPGAYKADLWRYCVLYIKGGIYLDVKYKLVNGFKLINLTDKEYYVRDRIYSIDGKNNKAGVYQALLSCIPGNKMILECIQKIVENCKNDIYNDNDLGVTGPHLLESCSNEQINITQLELYFTGNSIINSSNNNVILTYYQEYREEQEIYQKTDYYRKMWVKRDIYNYPTLKFTIKTDLTRNITKNILGEDIQFFSGTPSILEHQDGYLVNIRWINYNYNNDGSKKIIPKQWISLNSRFLMNKDFIRTSEEVFLEEDFEREKLFCGTGLEDIRMFNNEDCYYYLASYFDYNRKVTSVSSHKFVYQDDNYTLNRNIILPNCYDTNRIRIIEKNWCFFVKEKQLYIVYKWFPLEIGIINYDTNMMNIVAKYKMSDFFKNARGSTPGYLFEDSIWFILHKAQSYKIDNVIYYNYQHFFAIFDLNMNLIRYSELFKFGDCKVEFCVGLVVGEKEIILSYSLLDTQSIIATYDMEYINAGIKWFYSQ